MEQCTTLYKSVKHLERMARDQPHRRTHKKKITKESQTKSQSCQIIEKENIFFSVPLEADVFIALVLRKKSLWQLK